MTKSNTPYLNEAAGTVGQETLDATPERVLKFLRGAGTVPAIRAALGARGYTQAEHDRGWTLLHAASGYGQDSAIGSDVDREVQGAVAELDAWDEDGFRVVRAALGRLHPEQAKVVLDGLAPSVGAGAIVGVKLLLDRIDALAASSNAADRKAVTTLAKRGIDDDERKRLRALVQLAERGTAQSVPSEQAKARSAKQDERRAALVELRAWFDDWSEMARASVKRRDRLIRLGLAKRKAPKKPAAKGKTAAPEAS